MELIFSQSPHFPGARGGNPAFKVICELMCFLFPSDDLVSLNKCSLIQLSSVLSPPAQCQGGIWVCVALATEEWGPPSPSVGRWDVASLACFLSSGAHASALDHGRAGCDSGSEGRAVSPGLLCPQVSLTG